MYDMPTRGIRLDYRLIANRMSQLMRLLVDQGSLSAAKTMSTLLLANMTAVNALIQAATTIQDLPAEQTLAGSSEDQLL